LLAPPFSADESLFSSSSWAATLSSQHHTLPIPQTPQTKSETEKLTLPATYHDSHNELQEVDERERDSLMNYLEWKLDVSRLNKIHEYLWLAGRPMSARPLHRQVVLDREVVLTEQADLHLVWRESRLFVKPLPEFLIDHLFWKVYLCKNAQLYGRARGFLMSYV
jgi:hypothetical protein